MSQNSSNHSNENCGNFLQKQSQISQDMPQAQLVLFNDDFNTFAWAIESLIDVCHFTFEQAEQLCLIIHYKGKAIIKKADISILKSMKEAFLNRGISAIIEYQ